MIEERDGVDELFGDEFLCIWKHLSDLKGDFSIDSVGDAG